jgi:hypothetical protein
MEKYAVIVKKTIHIPGDERSRTNPGHGYPESTETHDELVTFKDKDDFMEWIKRNESRAYGKQAFKAIMYTELTISTSINIDVKIT